MLEPKGDSVTCAHLLYWYTMRPEDPRLKGPLSACND